jgi:hypothetical protein
LRRVQFMNLLIIHFLHPPIISSIWGPYILLTTLLSNTLNLCSSRNFRDKLSHSYKTKGRIIVWYIFIFTFLHSRWENKMFWTEM